MTEAAVGDIERRAASLRRHVIRQAAGKGEGYVGQGMQSADIFAALFFNEMNWSGQRLDDPERDRFLLSVGHYAIALYAALAEAGTIPLAELETYGSDGSRLPMSGMASYTPGNCFATALDQVKPTDALVVGMYVEFGDEAGENAAVVRYRRAACPP